MSTQRKRVSKKPKRKGKIVVKQKAELRKKNAQPQDSLKQAKTKVPDNGAVFKIKIKKK